MNRIACLVEYLGTACAGFQRQTFDNLRTVQGELERAISQVANERIDIVCAGRTDSGVHATGQVIHFDTYADRKLFGWLMGVNSQLPDDISIREVVSVSPDFHARFSATARRYHYVFYTRPTQFALYKNRVSFVPLGKLTSLDIDAMQTASQYLIVEQDFSSFRASECQANTPNRCIEYIRIQPIGDVVVVDIKANAFLHHMVRNIVGTLLEVGKERRDVDWVQSVLEAKDRKQAGPTAPPDGLYLVEVDYPDLPFQKPFVAPF